jgi:hypothetical protein
MKRRVEFTVAPLSWLPDGVKGVNKDLLSHRHAHVMLRMTLFHHLSLSLVSILPYSILC